VAATSRWLGPSGFQPLSALIPRPRHPTLFDPRAHAPRDHRRMAQENPILRHSSYIVLVCCSAPLSSAPSARFNLPPLDSPSPPF
jgi:hypothetical protein